MDRSTTSTLSRRNFLKTGLWAAGSAAVVGSGGAFAAGCKGGGGGSFSLEEATVAQVQGKLRSNEITCAGLVEQYLRRIRTYDMDVSDGPAPNAFVMINPQVRERAMKLDALLKESGPMGPLHGIPVLIKDTIDVAGLPTMMGTLALQDCVPPDDAFLVRKLREAGAIVLGKTTMDEVSSGASGQSSRSGFARNAYDTTKNSSGSSSGSAVGVSANFGMLAVGADSECSIRSPASYNGIVGLRPTPGLVSRDGTIDGYQVESVYGPMARTVDDLARLLDVIAAPDPNDPKTLDPELKRPDTYTAYLDPDGLVGRRIGVLRRYGENDAWGKDHPELISPVTRRAHDQFLDDLRSLGADVVDPVHFPEYEHLRVVDATREANNQYLRSFDAPYDSIFEVYRSERVLPSTAEKDRPLARAVSRIHEDDRLTGREKKAKLRAAMKKLVAANEDVEPGNEEKIWRLVEDSEVYKALYMGPEATLDHKDTMRSALEGTMDRYRLDALVFPETPYGPAYPSAQADDVWVTGANAGIGTITLMPSIVVPAGYGTLPEPYAAPSDEPRPFGMEFMARKYDEPTLIRLAYAYEQGTQHRRRPAFSPPPEGGPSRMDLERFNAFKLDAARAFFPTQKNQTDLGDAALASRFAEVIRGIRQTGAAP